MLKEVALIIYQALYREYRPQTFLDVVGQEHVVRTLQNMLSQRRVYHAFLFCGPRGTGKTTLAKILAKALNCQNSEGPTPQPCLVCASCTGIKEGSNIDVLEIDGASNRGIDEIRDLRESVKFAPSQGRYKIYIIDEVHMLTTEAFNALLKTLEEPPSHVVFIFATTEPQKLPATILSRVQRFDFSNLSPAVIAERLQYVADEAGIKIQSKAISVIARAAAGGLRDALAMLDQAHSYAGGETIGVLDVQEVIGLVADEAYADLWRFLALGQTAAALERLWQILGSGREAQLVLTGFLRFCRGLLLYRLAPAALPADESAVFKQMPGDNSSIFSLVEELLKAERDLRFVQDASILLELSFLRFQEHNAAADKPAPQAVERDDLKIEPGAVISEDEYDYAPPEAAGPLWPEEISVTGAEEEIAVSQEEAPPKDGGGGRRITIFLLKDIWPHVLARIMSKEPGLGAALSKAQLALEEDSLILRFEKEFSKNYVLRPEKLNLLREELSNLCGQTLGVDCVLIEDDAQEAVPELLTPDQTNAHKVALSLFEGQAVDPL